MSEQLSELEIQRRQSLEELINLGINPYPAELFPVSVSAKEVNEKFVKDSGDYQEVSIAGRIMTRRIMGMQLLLFFKIQVIVYRYIYVAMIFVRAKTKHFTIRYLRNYLISVILLV
jgi:lysyl-tRNA synthetase class II